MACEEVKAAKYQTRKSPPFHASHCKDLTKKGKDGDYVSKSDVRGVYKWIKVHGEKAKTRKLKKGTKMYLIHDNGGKPFKVEVVNKTVEIYKGSNVKKENGSIDYDTMIYDDLIKKLIVKEIHIGKSPCIPSADSCHSSNNGNTILLHVSGNKYIYIGYEIYEFTIEDTFEDYYSVIGNNDVPYPILLGSKYVYLMLDHKYIPRELFKAKMNAAEWADAYTYYYGFKNFETGEKTSCFEKYRTNVNERKKCEKKNKEHHRKIIKGADKKMNGVKLIQKRL